MDTFRNWLKAELETRNLSQKELAEKSGITPAQISRIISGSRGAGDDAIVAIARALRIPPETVFRAAGILPNRGTDPWLDEMSHKLSQLDDSRKNIAAKLLDALLDEQERK